MKAAEYRALVTGRKFAKDEPRRPKYRNEKTTADGIVFDSKREASRYLELRMAEKHGRIRNLRLQFVFPIVINGVRICDYVADFVYQEMQNGAWVDATEDAKGHRTDVFKLKRRLMKAVHGITIRET